MRFVIIAAAIAAMPISAVAAQNAPTWRGKDIAATADPIPVRDLEGRDVPHRDYRQRPTPSRPPNNGHEHPDRSFWIGPSITVGSGDYLPKDRSTGQDASAQCVAQPSGPPSASSAIASAASASGRRCETPGGR